MIVTFIIPWTFKIKITFLKSVYYYYFNIGNYLLQVGNGIYKIKLKKLDIKKKLIL